MPNFSRLSMMYSYCFCSILPIALSLILSGLNSVSLPSLAIVALLCFIGRAPWPGDWDRTGWSKGLERGRYLKHTSISLYSPVPFVVLLSLNAAFTAE